MTRRVVVLGAGFGGLELSTILSAELGDAAEIVLIDKGDAFVFGYSKLDVMFGRATLPAVRLPYRDIAKPGVRFRQEEITAIDPVQRVVTTDAGVYEADVLVVALGADYDIAGTPGLEQGGHEFYSVEGAAALAPIVRDLTEGHVVIGVCDAPFKCPPAPSECALMIHDELTRRGVRDACEISVLMPLGTPVPPSPETSAALQSEFAVRGIEFIGGRRISSLDPVRDVAALDDGTEVSYDLFLAVPRHRAPQVVIDSGMTQDGYVPVDFATLRTQFPGVFAVGDVATAGVPKAGVFAEGAARIVAQQVIADIKGGPEPERHLGQGSCYIEFGGGRVARVDIDFLSGPERTGVFRAPSSELVAEKAAFGSSRRARWFGA